MAPHGTALGLALALALAACGDDDAPDIDAGTDAGEPDAGVRAPDVCDELALSRAPMRTTGTGDGFGEVAGDFTVQTLSGPWTLSEHWSGCESYVFLVHFPTAGGDELFATGLDRLFNEGPRNTRYFFLSHAADPAARRALVESLARTLEEGLAFWEIPEADRDFRRERIHFVTDRVDEVEGSVGAHVRSYLAWAQTPEATVDLGERGRAGAPAPAVFGIDRAQTWDPGGNLSPAVGRAPELGMAAFLGHYYEYRGRLDARLAAEEESGEASVVSLLDERTTLRVFTREVTLPDAAAMAGFDRLEVDVEITCEAQNPFACSEWDRIAGVHLCASDDCSERLELARWITPYWRRGRQRWAIDATPLLALLRDGGTRSFFVELGPEWERATEWVASVSLRFRATGEDERAIGGERAFTGGTFDSSYNTREPFRFTPPAGAARVELVTILSGHGQTDGDNCAEWCDHRHAFSVNGTALPVIAHEGARIGGPLGCASRASEGVLPGQWGNWAQARAYWCPGLPVEARRTDITAQVRLGEENELTYAGAFRDGAPNGGDIALSAYVVWYDAR